MPDRSSINEHKRREKDQEIRELLVQGENEIFAGFGYELAEVMAEADRFLVQERWAQTVEALTSIERGEVVSADRAREWLLSWGKDDELDPPAI